MIRYEALEKVWWELDNLDKIENPRNSHEVQLDYVDKNEAFHQQVYACLSALILFLNNTWKHSLVRWIPI